MSARPRTAIFPLHRFNESVGKPGVFRVLELFSLENIAVLQAFSSSQLVLATFFIAEFHPID